MRIIYLRLPTLIRLSSYVFKLTCSCLPFLSPISHAETRGGADGSDHPMQYTAGRTTKVLCGSLPFIRAVEYPAPLPHAADHNTLQRVPTNTRRTWRARRWPNAQPHCRDIHPVCTGKGSP